MLRNYSHINLQELNWDLIWEKNLSAWKWWCVSIGEEYKSLKLCTATDTKLRRMHYVHSHTSHILLLFFACNIILVGWLCVYYYAVDVIKSQQQQKVLYFKWKDLRFSEDESFSYSNELLGLLQFNQEFVDKFMWPT